MSSCEVCRHPYWDNHVQATRLNAFTDEAVKGRCRDCLSCELRPIPAESVTQINEPEVVPA